MKSKIKCPFCNKQFSEEKSLYHFNNRCLNKENKTIYDYYCLIYSKEKINEIIEKYKNGYSLDELRYHSDIPENISNLSLKAIIAILNFFKIKIRSLDESQKSKRRFEKIENTLHLKYGENISNISQLKEVKIKKANTFIKHYGVDNIRKYKPFYDYVNEICIKKFGKKRLSGYENLTNEERQLRIEKMIQTMLDNGVFEKMRQNWWTSTLEKRFKEIFDKNKINYKRQFFLDHHPFDFLYDNKILIEINGDYWHCNPKFYKENFYLKQKQLTAKEIWEIDKNIEQIAIRNGYKFVVFWESEINILSDLEILLILEKAKNDENNTSQDGHVK